MGTCVNPVHVLSAIVRDKLLTMATVDLTTPTGGLQVELMRRFTAFLDSDNGHGALAARIQQMVSPPDEEALRSSDLPKRLIVSIDDLRDFDPDLANNLMNRPIDHLPVLERTMHDLIMGIRQDLALDKRKLSEYRVGLDGAFGARHVSPRGLNATLVGGVVSVEGIVTRASVVRPRLVLSVHYCPITKKFHEKTFRDNASVSSLAVFTQNAGMPGSSYPTKDEEGNPLETEFGRCWYRDSQRLTIQEMPEKSPPGQLPRSVDVLLEGDLCDVCKPGDRVNISGIFRAVGGAAAASGTGLFSTFVVANHISLLSGVEGQTSVDNSIHEEDIRNFIEYSSKGNVLDRMARSIAPSICGHDYIKKALLLLLIGGRERNLANGTHLRGDLNVLMVGDPSTAKSQLLRFIMNTAPLAVSTTGRGSSGVGLTAAVTTDTDTGDRHLEAGAMVLADRGVVCIDEFDKMSDEDRVAIHEVMEQQTVTIAKAGIHASLNARCSVVAAANPVYGSYDKRRKPNENIALPDSLLSRFDLLFIVLDVADKERDRQIADHVLRGHRFRKTTDTLDERDEGETRAHASTGTNVVDGGTGGTPMYESAASVLYRSDAQMVDRGSQRHGSRAENKILSNKFLKQYISYAKHRVKPTLTSEAAELIASVYQTLRQNEDDKTQYITARCLETLIRLATAHAKLRLDKSHVQREDAIAAAEVLRYALFNQTEPDKPETAFQRRSRRNRNASTHEKGGEDDDNSDDDGDLGGDNNDGNVGGQDVDMDSSMADHGAPGTNGELQNVDHADAHEPSSNSRDVPNASALQSVAGMGGSGQGTGPESAEGAGGSQYGAETNGNASMAGGNDTGSRRVNAEQLERVKGALNQLRTREGTVNVDAMVNVLDGMERLQVVNALEELQSQDVVVVVDDEVFIV